MLRINLEHFYTFTLPLWTETTILEQKEICILSVVSGFLKLNSLERGLQRGWTQGTPKPFLFAPKHSDPF